jgi:hypothetical protein
MNIIFDKFKGREKNLHATFSQLWSDLADQQRRQPSSIFNYMRRFAHLTDNRPVLST